MHGIPDFPLPSSPIKARFTSLAPCDPLLFRVIIKLRLVDTTLILALAIDLTYFARGRNVFLSIFQICRVLAAARNLEGRCSAWATGQKCAHGDFGANAIDTERRSYLYLFSPSTYNRDWVWWGSSHRCHTVEKLVCKEKIIFMYTHTHTQRT